MNSLKIINQYLELLEQEQKLHSPKNWYSTYLANKHRFYPNSEKLLNLIQGKTVTRETHSKLICFKNSFRFLVKFGIELALIKNKEKQNLLSLKKISQINILKTFSYDHSFKNNSFIDPFLGDLHLYLKEKQRNVIFVYEHLGKFETYRLNKVSNVQLINLYVFISWKDYFFQYLQLFKNFFAIKLMSTDPILNFVRANFNEERISPQFYMHDMHHYAFKNMIKGHDVQKIYSTFENNSWEKMLILARNSLNSNAQIIAHQHVPIAPSALNYYLTKTEVNLLPDRIVTVGKVLTDFLRSLSYPEKILRSGCALRLKLVQYPLPENSERLSLIALDGIPQAAVALNTILKNIEFFKKLNWKFIVRFHPLFGLERIQPYLVDDICKYDIFEISKATLEEDILKTNCVFYWGSSVAFEAMYSGRIVVHTPGDEILSNDPITLSGGLHFIASNIEETINIILNMSEEELSHRRAQSISYCQEYFGIPNSETLKSFD